MDNVGGHMHMHFWLGIDMGDFFIPGLEVDTTTKFIILCISLFLLSICYEALKVHKARSKAKTAREQRQRASSHAPSESATLLSIEQNQNQESNWQRPTIQRFLESTKEVVVFLFTNVLNYFLMLTVMLYNGYLFIVIVLGFTIGYFLFGHISMKINMENLQAINTKIICSTACRQEDEDQGSTSQIPSVSERISTKTALERLRSPTEQNDYGSTSCH